MFSPLFYRNCFLKSFIAFFLRDWFSPLQFGTIVNHKFSMFITLFISLDLYLFMCEHYKALFSTCCTISILSIFLVAVSEMSSFEISPWTWLWCVTATCFLQFSFTTLQQQVSICCLTPSACVRLCFRNSMLDESFVHVKCSAYSWENVFGMFYSHLSHFSFLLFIVNFIKLDILVFFYVLRFYLIKGALFYIGILCVT